MSSELLSERRGATLVLTISDPATRNTLSTQVIAAVTSAGSAFDEALGLAERLATMAPNALASAKELLEQAGDNSFSAQLAAERDHFLDNLFHVNGAEGIQAFLEKRAPRFS